MPITCWAWLETRKSLSDALLCYLLHLLMPHLPHLINSQAACTCTVCSTLNLDTCVKMAMHYLEFLDQCSDQSRLDYSSGSFTKYHHIHSVGGSWFYMKGDSSWSNQRKINGCLLTVAPPCIRLLALANMLVRYYRSGKPDISNLDTMSLVCRNKENYTGLWLFLDSCYDAWPLCLW